MTTIDSLSALTAGGGAPPVRSDDAGSADRFLKLLVAQMQNQDPLNPLDNAQVTSQMAQINTVSGIETLNRSLKSLGAQVVQLQMMQGANLVGRDITVPGNRLASAGDVALGGFELNSTADRVQVEILNGAGIVVQTLELGTQPPGRHGFQWGEMPETGIDGYSFRIKATAGAQQIPAQPLMLDRVVAVRTAGEQLRLDTLFSGSLAYADVLAFN